MRQQFPHLAGLLIAALVTGFTIRYASFVPWGTDPGSYVAAARHWADADLFSPEHFQLWAPWPEIGVPLGSRHSVIRGTHVSMYPLGFPVFLAIGDLLDRDLGVHVVPPLFAGVLVWSVFSIASRLANEWAGLLAATLMALSPIAFGYSVTPMSDVPAAAFTLLAIAMSLRGSAMAAAAAGASLAAAVMIRPILAPLGIVPLTLVLTNGAGRLSAWRMWQWGNGLIFLSLASVGPVMVGWSQHVLYGAALSPGYIDWEKFFSREHIRTNLSVYPRNLMVVHSPFVLLGMVTAIPLYFAISRKDALALRALVALIALVLLNYAAYLPYLTYDDVWFGRFVLPAQAALFVLLAVALVYAVMAVARLSKALAIVCLVPAAIVMNEGRAFFPTALATQRNQAHIRLMGLYLREVLPPNAAVVSFLHSGALAHYTGRDIVRLDFVHTALAHELMSTLVRRGQHPVFLIDQANEGGLYTTRFAGTKYEHLEWRPRAQFIGSSTLWYYDLRDRDGSRDGHPAPIDVLR